MNFMQTLTAKGYDYVLSDLQFRPIVPTNGTRFAKLLKRIAENNLRVYVDYDCDPDGYFSALALVETFKLINFHNYTLVKHCVKRHSLSAAEVTTILNGHYDVVFVLDSSTNDLNLITQIAQSEATLCIIDHHESHYLFADHPQNAIIINPKIDSLYNKVCYDCLSAGALTALLCAFTLQTEFSVRPPTDLYLYGVITLYSDIMDLSNEYNIAYISKFQNTQLISSRLIKLFWDEKYSHFDKSYISFKLIPRLNALFRTENFNLLYKLFFECESLDYAVVKQQIEDHYIECRKYTDRLVASCQIDNSHAITVAVMQNVYETYARNFTGLVANKLASEYNKPVLCLHQTTPVLWGGSVRDPLSRNALSLFRPLCYAEGHKAAFGVEIPVAELNSILYMLDDAMASFTDTTESVVIFNWDENPTYQNDIQLMAAFNEFGGQGLPMMLGALTVQPRFKIYQSESKISVYGDRQKFLCFVPTLDVGDTMLVKPTLSGSSYVNMVNTIHLN